jgi:outer membrane lipoprotein SlyB
MAGVADLIAPDLAFIWGGVLGAAVGGFALFAANWSGARLQGGIAACAVAGALLGMTVTRGLQTPAFASFAAGIGIASDDAEMERVLKTYYPDDYAQASATERTLKATGASDVQVKDALRKVAMSLMQRQMPLASTDNALAYLDIAKDEQEVLSADPDLCYQVLIAPTPDAFDQLQQKLPPDLRAREAHLTVKMLEQTATAPQPAKMTDDLDGRIKIWIRDAYWGLSFDERDALKGGGGLQSKAGCDLVGNFLRPLDLMGGTDAAETYKALTTQGLQQFNVDEGARPLS